nr:PREDICTED: uncharacterized protein LOC109035587 isoform X2 [Bemisia tabaci]
MDIDPVAALLNGIDAQFQNPVPADRRNMLSILCTYLIVRYKNSPIEAFHKICFELMKKVVTAKIDPAVNVKVED